MSSIIVKLKIQFISHSQSVVTTLKISSFADIKSTAVVTTQISHRTTYCDKILCTLKWGGSFDSGDLYGAVD